MESKMIVYYGTDLLPYKDKQLQVHYPIVGSAFQGASQTTCIRFYITNIVRQDSDIWLVVAKLPNGQVGYTRVEVVEENGESYFDFYLTRWHTQYKGDLYLNLQCYDGGVEFEYDDETGLYFPSGVPVVQVSGSVKLAINYATGIIDSGDLQEHTLQEILAYISNKLDRDSDKYIKVVDNITNINTLAYKDYLKSGDIVLSKYNNAYYIISGTYPTLTYTFANFLFNDININSNLYVVDFSDIIDQNGDNLEEVIASAVVDKVVQPQDETISFADLMSLYGADRVMVGSIDEEIILFKIINDEQDNTKCYVNITSSSGTFIVHDLKTKTLTDTLTFVFYKPTNNFIIINSTQGTLTSTQKLAVLEYNAYIMLYNNGYYSFYFKQTDQESDSGICIFEKALSVGANNGVITFTKEVIQVNKSTGSYQLTTTTNTTYTKDQIDTLFSSALVYKGSLSVSDLNALDKTTLKTGWFYNVSDKGTLTWTESGVSKSLEVLEGDNVAWTGSGWDKMTMDLSAYDDKFIAAGFFEVQDYNETTGTITLVYASDLYTMSYDDDSGVLTIQAN